MHIVNVAFECAAFDARLMRGGLSTLVWHLARAYVRQGQRVSIVTPAHGIDHLRAHYDLVEVYADDHVVPLVLDPNVWRGFRTQIALSLCTRAFLLRYEGVDIYFLSNAYLDLLAEQLYPDREFEGHELSFFKPLVFQVDCIRFIETFFLNEPLIVQAYEPYYHYVLPAILGGRSDRTIVSTIPVNVRIEEKVYRPQLEKLFALFGVDVELDRFSDPTNDGELAKTIAAFRRPAHQSEDLGPDYVCYFSLVATYCDLIDFLSIGQRDYHATFRDSPFQKLFEMLTVSRVIKENAHKHFVGGCALPEWWLEKDSAAVDRARVLGSLGLDPQRPTFFHAARFAASHKGQLELMRAIDAVLATDRDVNFVIRCAMGTAADKVWRIGNAYMQEVADRYPGNVYLDWRMVDEHVLFDHAASADFCIFPSKNETDAFLIAQGEAMACGAVPIATAQEVTRHFGHHRPLSDPEATGFAVRRSFRRDDPLLAAELADRIREALAIFRSKPQTYRRLAANARQVARTFVWERCARRRLTKFAAVARGQVSPLPDEVAIRFAWFDRLSEAAWTAHRDRILLTAKQHGDLEAYRRCAPVDDAVIEGLFAAAFERADFDQCERLAAIIPDALSDILHGRCQVDASGDVCRIAYRLPHAECVDLFWATPAGSDTEHRTQRMLSLRKCGDVFRGTLDMESDMCLVFMLTLRSGRVAWDCPPLARS